MPKRLRTLPRIEGGFTLVELLAVIAILAILSGGAVVALGSLRKSHAREASVSRILGTLENARALALRDGRPVSVAFAGPTAPGDLPYRAWAVFQRQLDGSLKEIVPWSRLPEGISFRNLDDSVMRGDPGLFPFRGDGTVLPCAHFTFGETGSLTAPTHSDRLRVVLFEGLWDGGGETVTARTADGEPVQEEIAVSRHSGRAKYMGQPEA